MKLKKSDRNRKYKDTKKLLSNRPKKIYLAGPMRYYPEFNFPAFFHYANKLKELGFVVFNPAERDTIQDNFNPKKDLAKPLRWYMKYDLPAVCESDAVVVMPGWEHSQGARLEVHTAREVGIPVFDVNAVIGGLVII